MKKVCIMVGVGCLAALSGCARMRTVNLVRGGEPVGVIVTADNPGSTAAAAARVLQETFEKMTGQTVPIVAEADYDGQQPAVAVGQTRIAAGMGIDVPQGRAAGDRYVIRRQGQHVALVGNDDGFNGSIYAAYDLLQRLGCGWYGPTDLWVIIPQTDAIRIPSIDVEEVAAFKGRFIWFVPRPLAHAWRLGGYKPRMGHNFWNLVSRTLISEHPDWFPHQPPGTGQPDICHPEVIEHIADQFMETLDTEEGFHSFSLCANDFHLWPDSEYTRAVGNAGAQNLYLANEVAKRLREKHPGRFELTFYIYWVTHTPPDTDIQAEPEVFAFMVNEGNKAKPWDEPEPPELAERFIKSNTREVRHFHAWHETGVRMGIREWWIPAFHDRDWQSLPWYAWETTVRNFRYWHEHGIRHIDIEALDYERRPRPRGAWPRRWPTYYIGARGLWNPDVDPEAVMREACDRLFGPAAAHMFAFYRELERAMFETPYFHQNWNMPPAHKVYTEAIVERATAHIEAAAGLAIEDSAIRERLDAEMHDWRETLDLLARYREDPPQRYKVYYDDQYMFWHDPEMTVGRIRSLIGLPNHIPVIGVTPEGEISEPAPSVVVDLTSGIKLYSKRPE